MKYPVKYINQPLTVACLLLWTACCIGFLAPVQALGDNSVADEIISLHVTDRPLGEVLDGLSIAANCQFSINESWEDYPVTASFDGEPLYRGLKLILRDINNAVIYGADRTVRIIVYGRGDISGRTAGNSAAAQPPQDFNRQPVIFGDATSPQPEIEISERSDDPEDNEGQPEEADESNTEMNETDAESAGNRDGGSFDASSGGDTAASESEATESASEEENLQAEEAEFASGGSDNSESLEEGEETNQN